MIHYKYVLTAFFSAFFSFFPYFALCQNNTVDSLKHILNNSTDVVQQSDALYFLALAFIRKDPEQTMIYAQQCIDIAGEGDYPSRLADCYLAKGMVQHRKSEFDSAKVIFEKVFTISQAIKDTSRMTLALGNLGMVNRRSGQYDKAIAYFLRALRLNEQRGNKAVEANLLADIGKINALAGDWDQAMVFQRQALALFKEEKQDLGISNTYNSIGVIHQEQRQLDSAMIYFERSLGVKEKIENWYGWATTKDNICHLLSQKGENNKALICFEELVAMEERLEAKAELALTLTNLAKHYAITGEYSKGMKSANRAYKIAEETGNLKVQKSACEALVELHKGANEFSQALIFEQEARSLSDSLLNETKSRQISELQIEYETEKNRQQIALQQLELDNKNQRIYFQRFLAGGIITILLALFGFVYWKNKKQEEYRRQEAAIIHQERLLQTTVDTMETERKRISKDLHDGIGQQLSGLKMAWQQLAEEWKKTKPAQAEKLDKLTNVLSETANDVRDLSHQIMPAALSRFGLVAAIDDMMQKSFANTPISYEFEYMDADTRYAENVEIGLYRITQELVNNIIKHSKAKNISVELYETQKYLLLKIEDDGIGFDIGNEKNKGNGLYNIRSRVKALKGSVHFEQFSSKGLCTTVRIAMVR